MRIAVISTNVFATSNPATGVPGYSGLEVIAWQCAQGLAKRGHQVILIAPDGSVCDGCQVFHTGPAGTFDERESYGGNPKRNYGGYWPVLLQTEVCIDHSWQKWAYMLKAEGRLKSPILGVCHAPVDTMFKELPPVEKPCMVCISDDQRDHFQGLWNRPAKTCYNGVDLSFYKPLGIPRSDRFLFLARFSSIKGADLAIKACLDAGVGLDLIGDTSITHEPDYFKECQRLSQKESPNWDKSKGKQIRLIGSVGRGEAVWWFSQAFAMLHPNQRFREPFGLAPVEALACECPVVAWRNGAMEETIIDAETGKLVDSYDELVQTIKYLQFNDPVHGDKAADYYRKHCRAQAEKFSVENMCLRYEELCLEAIRTGGW